MLNGVESFKVASTLSANRIVYVSAADTVAYGTTVTNCPIGITTDTVLDTTMAIPVKIAGIARLEFNDSVSAGGLVGSNTLGMGVPFVAVTAASWAVGILLSTKVNTTGTVADVLVMPIGGKNLT